MGSPRGSPSSLCSFDASPSLISSLPLALALACRVASSPAGPTSSSGSRAARNRIIAIAACRRCAGCLSLHTGHPVLGPPHPTSGHARRTRVWNHASTMRSMSMITLFELAMRAGVIAVMSSATAGPVASDTSGRLHPRKNSRRELGWEASPIMSSATAGPVASGTTGRSPNGVTARSFATAVPVASDASARASRRRRLGLTPPTST